MDETKIEEVVLPEVKPTEEEIEISEEEPIEEVPAEDLEPELAPDVEEDIEVII